MSVRPRTAVVALAIALLSGCGRQASIGGDEGRDAAADAVVEVRVAAVVPRSFETTVTAPGQWRSSGELAVSASFAGVVETLTARVGDRVTSGQKLGTIVTRESWDALRGAQLLGEQARDERARAEAGQAAALAQRDIVRVPLVAPQAGVIIRRSSEPGAQVAESAELLAIVPTGNVVFEAHVPAMSAAPLRVGEHATILEQDGSRRPAEVQRVLPMTSDEDQSALAWLVPDAHAREVVLDRYGSARIVTGPRHLGLAVPDSAIVEDDLTGQHRLAVIGAGARIVWTAVDLGMADAGWHELIRPVLAAGTKVVISGQRGLPDSTRVKWLP